MYWVYVGPVKVHLKADEAQSNVSILLHVQFLFAPLCLQDVEKLADFILKSVLTLTTVYYWLPKSHGKSN